MAQTLLGYKHDATKSQEHNQELAHDWSNIHNRLNSKPLVECRRLKDTIEDTEIHKAVPKYPKDRQSTESFKVVLINLKHVLDDNPVCWTIDANSPAQSSNEHCIP